MCNVIPQDPVPTPSTQAIPSKTHLQKGVFWLQCNHMKKTKNEILIRSEKNQILSVHTQRLRPLSKMLMGLDKQRIFANSISGRRFKDTPPKHT